MYVEQFFTARSQRKTPKPASIIVEDTTALPLSGRGSAWKHTRTGARVDLDNTAFRSGWEANLARVLQAFEIKFEFEPSVFTFPVKRGTKGYTPDFYLPATQEWVEVKGFFDDKSRIKLKRFKKYYPDDFARLTLIIGNSKTSLDISTDLGVPQVLLYPHIAKAFRDQIANWEGK